MRSEINIEKLAKLSRLEMTPRLESLLGDLEDMLGLADSLPESPVRAAPTRVNVMRDDIPLECLPNAELLKNSPDSASGCFRVPRTVGGES